MIQHQRNRVNGLVPGLCAMLFCVSLCVADDQPQWGQRHTRNMVSSETGLVDSFDPDSGHGIKWSVSLGREAYGSPVVAGGRVLVGANNKTPRDPRYRGDRAVLLCLNETDGALRWQLAVPRIAGGDIYKDWPNISMCSPPTVEGDRVYILTNRVEVICLDLKGQRNGNQGFQDEAAYLTAPGESPAEVTLQDADLLWVTDLRKEVGMYPHDSAHASILIDGDWLYLNSSNGVDKTHKTIQRPEAPSLIVLDKTTGRCVAQDGERIGPQIFHSTWSSPSLATINHQKQVIFAGGNGIVYGFEALGSATPPKSRRILKQVWRFDCDPKAPKEDVRSYQRNRRVSPTSVSCMPVFHDDRVFLTAGGDIWWGKETAWLLCVDPTLRGNVTDTARVWSYPLKEHAVATPAIHEGLVYAADCSGQVHCVDAKTGLGYWTHALKREIWGATLVADGKVYAGSRRGDFCILSASKDKKVLCTVQFDAPISTTPVAANGVLYVATQERLYAIEKPNAK